jgi:hypothetical protein
LFLEHAQSGVPTFGFDARESEGFADGDAEAADCLLVIHD